MRTNMGLLAMALVVAGATGASAHFFPAKATSLKAQLVQSYQQCTSPGTMTSSGKPACLSSLETDPTCVFESNGSGTLSASIHGTSIVVKGSVRGISASCEGKTLHAAFKVRTTTDDCPMEHCTVVDQEIDAGSCIVTLGRCSLSATVATGYPAGAGSEMSILTCEVDDGMLTAFNCGIMVK